MARTSLKQTVSLLHTKQSLPEHFLFLFRVRFGVAQMHCLEEVDVDLSQLLYYSYTALKCCHTHNSPNISNRNLCTHIPDIFLFFGCRYSCTGRSIQSKEQRKFLVVYIQQIGSKIRHTRSLYELCWNSPLCLEELEKAPLLRNQCSLVEL